MKMRPRVLFDFWARFGVVALFFVKEKPLSRNRRRFYVLFLWNDYWEISCEKFADFNV